MKFALITVAVVTLVVVVVFVVGAMTPKDHQLSLSQDYPVPAATLYQLVRNYEAYPGWRTGVKSMQRDGDLRYIEESSHGKIPYKIIEDQTNKRVVAKIDDASLPFSGTWTFEISDHHGNSQLRITETGSVPNPLMRFFATYVFSPEKTMRTYLADVTSKLQQKP